jgi:hypothetical protein
MIIDCVIMASVFVLAPATRFATSRCTGYRYQFRSRETRQRYVATHYLLLTTPIRQNKCSQNNQS